MSKKNRKPPTNGNHREPVKVNADDQLLDLVERKVTKTSRQPDRDMYHNIWTSTLSMVSEMGPMPSFDKMNVDRLDEWCRKCLMKESYLSGFLAKITSAQANRGWSLYGGKRIVNATAEIFHRFDPATVRMDDGRVFVDEFRSAGWRRAAKRKSLSYLTRCKGTFVEIQYRMEPRFTLNGWQLSAVTNLYNMDSSKVEYTGDPLYPIRYDGSADWPAAAYYHLVSSPFDTSEFYEYGLSPLYRCIRLAQLMVNISDWELGTLADDFVDSVLLLNGATDEEFNADAGVWKTIQRGGGVSAGMYRAGYKKRRMESVLEWVDANWPTEEQSRQEKTTAIAAEYVSARETLNTAVQLLLDLFDSAIVKNDSEQPDPQLEADRMKALRIVTEAFLRTTKLEIQRQPLGELSQLSDGTLLGERHGQAQRASEVFAATDRKTFTGLREILGFLLQPKLDALNLEYIEAGKTRSRQSNGTIVVRRNPEMEQTVTEELQLPARNKLRQLNSWIDQKWPGEKPLVIKRWK